MRNYEKIQDNRNRDNIIRKYAFKRTLRNPEELRSPIMAIEDSEMKRVIPEGARAEAILRTLRSPAMAGTRNTDRMSRIRIL